MCPVPGVFLPDPYAMPYLPPPPSFLFEPPVEDPPTDADRTGILDGEESALMDVEIEYSEQPSLEEYLYGSFLTFDGFANVMGQCVGLSKNVVKGAPRLQYNRITDIPKTDWACRPGSSRRSC